MPYGNNILTSIYGRRLGLQRFDTAQSGAARPAEFVVGPDDIRLGLTTNESTGTAMAPAGISVLVGTSVASTPVFTLAPPIPGVRKVVVFGSTNSALYAKASSGCAIAGTSLGTTGATAIRSSGGGAIELMGRTTAIHDTLNVSSTAVNGVGFQATT
jgi:hypothetical protein